MKCSRRCERADNEGSRPLDMKLEKRMSQAETLLERSPERFTRRMWGKTSIPREILPWVKVLKSHLLS